MYRSYNVGIGLKLILPLVKLHNVMLNDDVRVVMSQLSVVAARRVSCAALYVKACPHLLTADNKSVMCVRYMHRPSYRKTSTKHDEIAILESCNKSRTCTSHAVT